MMSMDAHERGAYTSQAQLCRVLTDPVRLALLHLIGTGERTVSDLVRTMGLRQANVSQHLAVLRRCGIVTPRREGTRAYYVLTYPEILDACSIVRGILARQRDGSPARFARG
jgi:ArsR family transcriptional regulator, virulence genes transcriptional regulator